MAAGVLSVMCANNLVNGVYVCENNHTTNHILREYGGFKGWMCSDYRVRRQTLFVFVFVCSKPVLANHCHFSIN